MSDAMMNEVKTTPVPPVSVSRDRTAIWLLAIGVALICPYLVVNAMGWREYTCAFSGTFSPADPAGNRAMAYAGSYFVAWMISPVFAIGAGVYGVLTLHPRMTPASIQ